MPKRQRAGRKPHQSNQDTTARAIILSLISERPMSGYDLLKEFDRQEISDWAQVSRAQVYYVLKALTEEGLVVADPQPSGSRRRTVIWISEDGRKALANSLGDPQWAIGIPPPPFMTWLGLSYHAPKESKALMFGLRKRFLETEILKKREALEFIANYPSPRAALGLQVVELYIRYLEAELAWLQETQPKN